jgi:hypothetical protein
MLHTMYPTSLLTVRGKSIPLSLVTVRANRRSSVWFFNSHLSMWQVLFPVCTAVFTAISTVDVIYCQNGILLKPRFPFST